MMPAIPTRPTTVNVPATAAVSEKKLKWGSTIGRVILDEFTYPEEGDWVVVEEGVAESDVRTRTDEEESGIDAVAAVGNVVGVKDADCCTTAVAEEKDDVGDTVEADDVNEEGVLWER